MKPMLVRKDRRVAILAGVGTGFGTALRAQARGRRLPRRNVQERERRHHLHRRDFFRARAWRCSPIQRHKVRRARGLAQSLAVELWPRGIHVAHVIIDGVIDAPKMRKTYKPSAKEPLLNPEAIADSYWNLIQQDRSAWSLEIDLRPHTEAFFECFP